MFYYPNLRIIQHLEEILFGYNFNTMTIEKISRAEISVLPREHSEAVDNKSPARAMPIMMNALFQESANLFVAFEKFFFFSRSNIFLNTYFITPFELQVVLETRDGMEQAREL